jgi:hypothetical protein
VEEYAPTDIKTRPLDLLALLQQFVEESIDQKSVCLIFASSVENVHRLARLLQIAQSKGIFKHSDVQGGDRFAVQ